MDKLSKSTYPSLATLPFS